MSNLLSDFLNDRIERVDIGGVVNGVYDYNLSDEDSNAESDGGESENEEIKTYAHEEFSSYFSDALEVGGLTDIDDGREESIIGSDMCEVVGIPRVFSAYRFDTYYKNELPIDSYKEKILKVINVNSVTIISGKTGCGKTTQVPQYLLDQCKAANAPCNIVVTQPRRIAAINIAQRVCEERGWALGSIVGYQVGLDKRVSDDVVLTYMTTEVLLQKLIVQKNLNKYTHVVIDEVHERNKHLDFLLLIVRKYLYTNSSHVKVILMSATMEEKEFAHYFRSIPRNNPDSFLPAPVLQITRPPQFNTHFYFLDNFINMLVRMPDEFNIDEPCIRSEQYQLAAKLVGLFDSADEKDPVTLQPVVGSVLIFLPGYHEIEEMVTYLKEPKTKSTKHEYEVIPLHSSLTTEHMARVFEKPKPNIRKVILSTNIAESSLTVPDVTYVIDFCLTKVMIVNPITKFSSLTLQWASHVNCRQRAGRVGRVSAGKVYRLVPESFYKNQMPSNTVPEIQRASLENIILYMKLLDLNDTPRNVLSLALSPPNLKDIENCIWHLKELGALLLTCRGKQSVSDGDLTFLGRVMGSLPVDIHLAKLVVLGHMFSCLDEAVIMAAGASTKNLFVHEFGQRLTCYKKKLLWADNSSSDFIALLNLHSVWLSSRRDNAFRTSNEEVLWCRKNYVNMKGLREWDILIKEINSRLKKFNIDRPVGPARVLITAEIKPLILKVIICGAFYPNYFIRSSDYGQVDANEAVKILNGRDIFNTVFFTNMKLHQPGQIYVRKIKELIKAGNNNVQIGFDGQSSKIFIEYKTVQQPEPVFVDGVQILAQNFCKIPLDVYEAVRKRQLRIPHRLQVLPNELAWEFVNNAEESRKKLKKEEGINCFSYVSYSPLPPLDLEYITLKISHVINAGHFYCQQMDNETSILLLRIYQALNGPGVVLNTAKDAEVLDDVLYAAKFAEDGNFYRCKIISKSPNTANNKATALVMFVDYGNSEVVPFNKICAISDIQECSVAPIAIECMLSEIKPSSQRYPNGHWGPDATEVVLRKTNLIELHAKVYSVVDGIVRLELYNNRNTGQRSLNQFLVEQGFAEKQAENYMSKENHAIREAVMRSDNPATEASQFLNATKMNRYQDFEQPEISENYEIVELKGPFSPLEMKICGIVEASTGANVRIDEDSVNTVLLDENPSDPHARLVVAGTVIQSDCGRRLKIGQTTVMPNIRSFPMYMILTFCPLMEPKLTPDGSRVASVLCGLGAREGSNRAYYPNHDIAFALDTDLDQQTIVKVNSLRFAMNRAIKLMSNIADELHFPEDFYAAQKNIYDNLFHLLKRDPPASVNRVNVPHAQVWNKYDYNDSDDVVILRMETENDDDEIWRMLWFVKLNTDKTAALNLNKNLDELIQIAKRLMPEKKIRCELCKSEEFRTMTEVRTHLFRNAHKANLARFKNEDE